MIAQWPEELPRPMREGFQRSFGEARLKSGNEAKVAGVRRRFSAVSDSLNLTFELDQDELARFERFYHEEVAQGSLPFTMTDPTKDGTPMADANGAYLTGADGAHLVMVATWLVLFGDQLPAISCIGNRWRVSFQINVLP